MTKLAEIYVTPAQAVSLLLVSRETIRWMVKQGKLRGEMIGNITLILKEDVRKIALQRGIKME